MGDVKTHLLLSDKILIECNKLRYDRIIFLLWCFVWFFLLLKLFRIINIRYEDYIVSLWFDLNVPTLATILIYFKYKMKQYIIYKIVAILFAEDRF